jgi:hypothetical protein
LFRGPFDDFASELHVGPFRAFVNLAVIDPAIAVTGNFVAQLGERRTRVRIQLQRSPGGKSRQRQTAFLEQAQDTPEADTRSIVMQALGTVASRSQDLTGSGYFVQIVLGSGVPVEQGPLCALLHVENELKRDTRTTRPLRMRRSSSVTAQVSCVPGVHQPNSNVVTPKIS